MPQPNCEDPQTQALIVSPRTDTERAMVDIWTSVLNRKQVGVFDDFLDLGGDSVYAAQCAGRIANQFSVQLPLEKFFVEPAHIAALAAMVDIERASRPMAHSALDH